MNESSTAPLGALERTSLGAEPSDPSHLSLHSLMNWMCWTLVESTESQTSC